MEKYAGARGLIVRKTRASLETTGLVTFKKIVLPATSAEVTYQGALYANGSEIVFGGMDKSSKIMSSEYDMAYVQEATELTEAEWEDITTRLRWNRLPWQQLIGDCNPAQPSHWLKRRANAGKTVMLESRHEDNPTIFDSMTNAYTDKGAKYLAKLDALSGPRYLRLRKGIWAAAEGMVYDTWDPAIHLINRFEIPRNWLRVWVVDFGYTNPFVWQAWARDPDGRWYRYREIYRSQRIVEDHAAEIKRVTKGEPLPAGIICDHDAEDRATLERHIGFMTVPAFKSVSPGIQGVQKRLRRAGDGRPRLYFLRDSLVSTDEELADAKLPTCTEEEIEGYVWMPNSKEEPVKKNDHGMDAMRYLVAAVDNIDYDPAAHNLSGAYNDPYSISPW